MVLDGSTELEKEDLEIIDHIGDRKVIVLLNKRDKGQKISSEEIKTKIKEAVIIQTSVSQGTGIGELTEEIEKLVYGGKVSQNDSLMVTNVRHKRLLEESSLALKDAIDMTSMRQPLEFIEIDVNNCYELLGEIIGETASDDIIEKVFERFCLGK